MITRETMQRVVPIEEWSQQERPSRIGVHVEIPEWSTNGHIAARFTGYDPGQAGTWTGPMFTENFPRFIRAWIEQAEARVAMTEVGAERIPAVDGIPDEGVTKCEACKGSGACHCACGDEHDCSECDGHGGFVEKRGRPRRCGQSTWRSADDREVIVADDYADLLRGYRVFLFTGDDGNETKPLLGVDDSGTVMVAVMPLDPASKQTVAEASFT